MKRNRLCRFLLHSLLLLPAASCLLAVTNTSADLSPAATNGKDAHDGIPARALTLHVAMACHNEFDFAQGFALASKYGKENYPANNDLAQWPVTLMLGKAELLLAQWPPAPRVPLPAPAPPAPPAATNNPTFSPPRFILKDFKFRDAAPADVAGPAFCQDIIQGDIVNTWAPFTADGKVHPGEDDAGVVNRVYHDLYDSLEGVNPPACAQVASPTDQHTVQITLSKGCLARQIRAVMTNPRHGPWTEAGGTLTPQLPGTSASKLPCLSEFKFKVKGLDGDWDMGVIEYTRLAGLLLRVAQPTVPVGLDVAAALDALNTRFLTLRSSPDQGATAREEFNLVASCGNLPNQFGSAADTVNGTGADPNASNYSSDANDAIGNHSSFWKKLLHFLKALAIVIAIAAAAVIVGAIVGAIAGAVAGLGALGAAAVAAAAAAVVFITFVFGGIQETENHLLMQNTSRYLKNKLMMAELSAQNDRKGFDTIASLNEDVRSWLLDHMQTIASDDFVEYNAKPYNRLSHASILNLLDYACDVSWNFDLSRNMSQEAHCDDKDKAIVTSAAAVLDLSAAKDAVGSIEGRRFIPYRRLMEQNYAYYTGLSMLELIAGADSQLAALQIWTGQMRHAPAGLAAKETFGDLEWYSTSSYRPDPLILDIAVNKGTPREQQYRHHTRERYASGNGWLITAGGTDEGPAQGFHSPLGFTLYPPISGDVNNDRGVGVPTTLMTGAQIKDANGVLQGRARVQEFLRFEGNKKDWGLLDEANSGSGLNTGKPLWSFSDNNCVAGSFACGLTLRFPRDFNTDTCRTVNVARNFFVVDSTQCDSFNDRDNNPANDIFIAIFQSPQGWGFFEVAQQDAYGRSASAFANALKAQNQGRFGSWLSAGSSDTVEYFAVTQNRLLKFTPADESFGADRRACGIVNHESGARFTISNVPAAQQGSCLSVGPRIFLDLNDAKNPIRRGEGGLALETFIR